MGGQMAWAHGHNTTRSAGNGLNGFNPWECSSSFIPFIRCVHALSEQRQEGWKEMGGGSDGMGSWAQYHTFSG